MNKPKVSVIIPVYNVEKYLDRCLKSVTNQSLSDIQIILVDDESPDNCPKICDEAKEKDSRISVIHKKNEGLGLARNSGLSIATGEYVYFVDSDDYLELNALEVLYNASKKDNCDICLGGIYSQNENGDITKEKNKLSGSIFYGKEIVENVLIEMMGSKPTDKYDTSIRMSAWQGIYRNDLLKDNKLLFPSEREFISEDIIFHIHALPCAHCVKYISDYVYYHIADNPFSLTHIYNPERFNKVTKLFLEEIKLTKNRPESDEMSLRAQRMYLGNVRVCIKHIFATFDRKKKREIKQLLKKIADSEELQNVLHSYPYWKNPIKQAIMSFLLKHKFISLIYCMFQIIQIERN